MRASKQANKRALFHFSAKLEICNYVVCLKLNLNGWMRCERNEMRECAVGMGLKRIGFVCVCTRSSSTTAEAAAAAST